MNESFNFNFLISMLITMQLYGPDPDINFYQLFSFFITFHHAINLILANNLITTNNKLLSFVTEMWMSVYSFESWTVIIFLTSVSY